MFQGLKKQINRQNLRNIKIQNRYDNDSSEEIDLDDVQLMQREDQAAKILGDLNDFSNTQNTKQRLWKTQHKAKHEKQLLLEEKIKLIEQYHEKQKQFLKDAFTRQKDALHIQISTLQFSLTKQKKQQNLIKMLRRDVQNLNTLIDQLNKRIDELSYQNVQIRNQKMKFMKQLKQYQMKQQQHKKQLAIKQNHQPNKLQLIELQYDFEKQKCKDFQQKYKLSERMIQQMRRQIESLKSSQQQQMSKLSKRYEERINDLIQTNKQLSKKKDNLEETIINHFQQQSHFIYTGARKSNHPTQLPNTTINLQQDSIHSDRKVKKVPQKADPEKNDIELSPIKKNQTTHLERCERSNSCYHEQKFIKAKQKLDFANKKIVELLKWKSMIQTRNVLRKPNNQF